MVMQRPAKPWTPVRFRLPPPVSKLVSVLETIFMAGWQSDYATVCKAVQAGLNPRPRLQF